MFWIPLVVIAVWLIGAGFFKELWYPGKGWNGLGDDSAIPAAFWPLAMWLWLGSCLFTFLRSCWSAPPQDFRVPDLKETR